MKFISYISTIAVPFVIFYIITYGFTEKIKVFDSFLKRSKRWNKNCYKNLSNISRFILSN